MPFPAKISPDAIIQSAAEIIHTNGLASLSMRTLASHLGVRASSLYRHFPDRSSIERILADRAAEQLLDCMKQSIHGATGDRALFAAGRAYVDYASSDQSLYEVLMRAGVPANGQPGAAKLIWDFFVDLVSAATQFDHDLPGAAAVWSFLHGFVVLSRSGQLDETTPRQAFARGAQALIRGLAKADAQAVAGF